MNRVNRYNNDNSTFLYKYPPGTAYNPIYVPPAGTPSLQIPTGRTPVNEPPVDFDYESGPPVTTDTAYIQAYLQTVIGRYVKIEFVLGTNMLIDREGTLINVGVDHIVLREPETDDLLIADLYSIKFVRVYY